MSYADGGRTGPDDSRYDPARWDAHRRRRPIRRRAWLPWLLAASMVTALGLAVAQTAVAPRTDALFPSTFALMMILLSAGAGLSPFARETWLTAFSVGSSFDEFERHTIALAMARAFTGFVGLTVLLLAIGWIGSIAGWRIPSTPAEWGGWCLALVAVAANLPLLIAELTVPMPQADGGEDEHDL